MAQTDPPVIVESWNEWARLTHLVVGRADDGHIPRGKAAVVKREGKFEDYFPNG